MSKHNLIELKTSRSIYLLVSFAKLSKKLNFGDSWMLDG